MKPIGKPRENVEKMDNKNQEKELIAKAGLELTDDGLGMVAGGANAEYHSRGVDARLIE